MVLLSPPVIRRGLKGGLRYFHFNYNDLLPVETLCERLKIKILPLLAINAYYITHAKETHAMRLYKYSLSGFPPEFIPQERGGNDTITGFSEHFSVLP